MKTWQDILQADISEVVSWAENQPFALKMSECAQDASWHAEGDVWTHTMMVCDELPKLDAWPALTNIERTTLLLTALLHDSAKPRTTRIDSETGRLRSPKHAVLGEHLARRLLREWGCDLKTREHIAKLVRYHGRPAFLLEKPEPADEIIGLSTVLSNKFLYYFTLADTRGRTTELGSADTTRPEETLHLWRLLAEENQCFLTPYPFANDQARVLFYRKSTTDLHYVPHEDYSCTVTLMSGLPGAGKDYWLNKHRPDLPVVSLDAIRSELGIRPTKNQGKVIQHAKELCRKHLRTGNSFAFSATNLTKLARTRWIDLFARYGARIEIIYVEPPMETILRQNESREQMVPLKAIQALAENYEPPTLAEAHHVEYFDGN